MKILIISVILVVVLVIGYFIVRYGPLITPAPLNSNNPGQATEEDVEYLLPAPTENPSPLSPCVQWDYAFPTDSPNFGLNGTPIPTGNPDYANSGFKTRKCVAVQTGVGPISTDPASFVKSVFSLVFG